MIPLILRVLLPRYEHVELTILEDVRLFLVVTVLFVLWPILVLREIP